MQRNDISAQLISDIKDYLNITWEDEATDRKIRGLAASGSVYLDGKGGEPLDYEADGEPRTLLFEYVRYMRDGAQDVFENNYLERILAMQNERAVSRNVEGSLSSN